MKRMVDTDIWDEDWFLTLDQTYMLFWMFVTSQADHAGFVRPNKIRFCQAVKTDIDLSKFVSAINTDKERILVLPNGRWWLTGFVRFHYGHKNTKAPAVLTPKSAVHRSIIQLLDLNNIPYDSRDYGFRVNIPIDKANEYLYKGIKDKRQKTKDIEKKDISVRSEEFKNEVRAYTNYPEKMLQDFYFYWSEPTRSKNRMRFELQPTWDLARRLKTWARRSKTEFIPKNTVQQYKQEKILEFQERQAEIKRARDVIRDGKGLQQVGSVLKELIPGTNNQQEGTE